MHLHINPIGGVSGDMFCGALIDWDRTVGNEIAQAMVDALKPTFGTFGLSINSCGAVLQGAQFQIMEPSDRSVLSGPRNYREIKDVIGAIHTSEDIRKRAIGIFNILATAESDVHKVAVDEVHFHEVGNLDSLADILIISALLEHYRISSATYSDLPIGRGRIDASHGILPVPAPATARLLIGLRVYDDEIGGERVTPTGAAILRSLNPNDGLANGGVIKAVGYGYGQRELVEIPNCLQAILIDVGSQGLHAPSPHLSCDWVGVIEFEIDDLTGEELGGAMESILTTNGVLSALNYGCIGKQGRPTTAFRILSDYSLIQDVIDVCFDVTSTLGVRYAVTRRSIIEREAKTLSYEGRDIPVKIAYRKTGQTAKVEWSAVRGTKSLGKQRALKSAIESRFSQKKDGEKA